MKAVEILEPFTGYPDGKTKRAFAPGPALTIPDDIPADFAKLIVGKRHAREVKLATKQEKVS